MILSLRFCLELYSARALSAEKFRKYVLTPGGIDDGMTMYNNFRGRDPQIDALLKSNGLK